MTTEAITTAIRSVLGDYTSPEKIREFDEALRPIYGAEAAEIAIRCGNFGDYKPEELTANQGLPKYEMMHSIISDIRQVFGVPSHD